jgi:hypothetical protein
MGRGSSGSARTPASAPCEDFGPTRLREHDYLAGRFSIHRKIA